MLLLNRLYRFLNNKNFDSHLLIYIIKQQMHQTELDIGALNSNTGDAIIIIGASMFHINSSLICKPSMSFHANCICFALYNIPLFIWVWNANWYKITTCNVIYIRFHVNFYLLMSIIASRFTKITVLGKARVWFKRHSRVGELNRC